MGADLALVAADILEPEARHVGGRAQGVDLHRGNGLAVVGEHPGGSSSQLAALVPSLPSPGMVVNGAKSPNRLDSAIGSKPASSSHWVSDRARASASSSDSRSGW